MADTSIKLSGTYDSIEAYNILEEMRTMETTIEGYKDDAETAATTAGNAATTAQGHANNASDYADNAQTYAGNASASADNAEASAANAYTSETNAATSATNAHNSEVAAASSETNAANSEDAAADSATAAAASAAEAAATLQNYLPLTGGNITGSLTVGSKDVERVNARGNGYIRFESGNLQICFGFASANNDGTDVTFPVPFISTPIIAISNAIATQRCWISNPSATSVTLKNGGTTKYNVYYIAIGTWK